jgi:DNA-binding transcriptional regulator WhiA
MFFKIQGDFVLTVANVDQRKNTAALVQVCEELGVQLVVIGAIKDREYFERFSHRRNAKFLGAISDQNLIKSALALQQAKSGGNQQQIQQLVQQSRDASNQPKINDPRFSKAVFMG